MVQASLFIPSLLCRQSVVARQSPIFLRHRAVRHRLRYYASSSPDAHPPDPSGEPSRDPQRSLQYKLLSGQYGDQLANAKERLRGWSERTASQLRQQIDQYTASLAVTFSQLGKEINKVTGYGEIEVLKQRVVQQEARIEAVRRAAREAKKAYDRAVLQRASSQREVNDLLQRKSNWNDEDVIRFTSLVRQDHLHEQEESRAKVGATQAEDSVEREFSELMRVILNRYHEEQAWSDKIRSASTYGSLAVMGVNMLVFLLAIVFIEPWKRRRLAQTFERKVEEMSAQSAELLESKAEALAKRFEGQDRLLSQIMEMVHYNSQVPEADQMAASQTVVTPRDRTEKVPLWMKLKSNQDVAWAMVTSATAAGLVGWLARSYMG